MPICRTTSRNWRTFKVQSVSTGLVLSGSLTFVLWWLAIFCWRKWRTHFYVWISMFWWRIRQQEKVQFPFACFQCLLDTLFLVFTLDYSATHCQMLIWCVCTATGHWEEELSLDLYMLPVLPLSCGTFTSGISIMQRSWSGGAVGLVLVWAAVKTKNRRTQKILEVPNSNFQVHYRAYREARPSGTPPAEQPQSFADGYANSRQEAPKLLQCHPLHTSSCEIFMRSLQGLHRSY